ncbi:MAG TPA: pantoate--beta-alanine ligase [Thermaerobacter sp.]
MRVIREIATLRRELAALRRRRAETRSFQASQGPAGGTAARGAPAGSGAASGGEERTLIGFVPTMGYLHEGHLSLIRRARAECDAVVVSVFVNPLQFGPGEDYERYPRDLERDCRLAAEAGADLLFHPDAREMYPEGEPQVFVDVGDLASRWEGAVRPGHFRGVVTVVTKLFHIVQPDRAYFGQKDAQQAVIIRRMAADLNFPLEVVVCPTVREADGLALSSRNVYLAPPERRAATVLYRALQAARERLEAGERDGRALAAVMEETVASEPLARLDYAAVVSPHTLEPLETVAPGEVLLLIAARIGTTRLIDNFWLQVDERGVRDRFPTRG